MSGVADVSNSSYWAPLNVSTRPFAAEGCESHVMVVGGVCVCVCSVSVWVCVCVCMRMSVCVSVSVSKCV